MNWIDNIYDLQYYNQPKDVPCYCELIVFPADMQLQGQVYGGNGSYSLKLYVYSADGTVQYEDATSYFSYYFGVMPGTGVHYFNAKLKSFSPAMCAHACYLIRAVVGDGTLFDKFTERYCINNCCDVARDIDINQVGLVASPLVVDAGGNGPLNPVNPVDPSVPIGPALPASACGDPLIRIISRFDCIDNFTGDFYGLPENTLSGTANFTHTKITNIKGRIVRRPRDIQRDMSFNCNLQRVESKPVYLVEGFEYFPAWKMQEIEGQLHANRIFIDDFRTVRRYQYAGGTPFKLISKCVEVFKLEAQLEDCTQRQIFGCGTNCNTGTSYNGSNYMFVLPEHYEGGSFYNDSGALVAEDYEGLLIYFRGQDGISDVQDIDIEDLPCKVHKVFAVTGERMIPNSFYMDVVLQQQKIYGKVVSSYGQLCDGVAYQCKKPVAGTITVETIICATPVTDTPVVSNIVPDSITVNGYGNWVKQADIADTLLYNRQVTLNIKVRNTHRTANPDDMGAPVYIAADVIGVIGFAARPANPVVIRHTENANVPEGSLVMISTEGMIRYSGAATSADVTSITIELNNLIYNL